MQIPIVKGRDFTLEDSKSSRRVVIVNEAFVNRYWPGQEGLGKWLSSDLTHESFTVIGVARNSKMTSLSDKSVPFVYLPLYQVYQPAMIVNARTAGDPMAYRNVVEKTLHGLNPDLVAFNVSTLGVERTVHQLPPASRRSVRRRIRAARAGARRGGNLRRHRLHYAAAHTRNQYPHGFGGD